MDITYSLKELPAVAEKILAETPHKIMLFQGEMGIGKTTLIKELAKKLGVEDTLTSPTFSLVNEYETKEGKMYHFDFYRIENEEEAWDIGFEDYLNTGHYIFIEWPEKVKNLLPENCVTIKLTKNKYGRRMLNTTLVK